MKYVDEYRQPHLARRLLDRLNRLVSRPWTLMEVCGGQTHTLLRSGIDRLVPTSLRLVHGPGCPVCVTPLEEIDRALAIARRPEVIFCSFGDMLRVPGSRTDLLHVRAEGGDVRLVYSPLDAVRLAQENPNREVVFFAVGFETTAPATALAVQQARHLRLTNFSLLVAHVRVPPALEMILTSPGNRVQAFLAPGHVCTVMGFEEYEEIVRRHRVPVVVTGFEPVDLLEGILRAVRQLEGGRAVVENQYARAVRRSGNRSARRIMSEVYEVCDRSWRGLGLLPRGGLRLKAEYRDFDAAQRFPMATSAAAEPSECRSGAVLQGLIRPDECPAFGTRCTPERPLGAPMVSAEGACAAYWKYGRGLAPVRGGHP
ncbi:MAG: hydrogenase formation protein HypD [Gemmataceae bacterium]|nr:hydrogenase formation protein HypD [Gemmataceae bacterium]MDW8267490.1 hydrogenase formation protein HypD [Gemmataceae bacterium]